MSTPADRFSTYSAPQARILAAAIELFDINGVAGTSLQMIANKIGVTKTAIYHQFSAKDDIVLAIGHLIFDQIQAMMERADHEPDPEKRRRCFVQELVELAVSSRDMAGFLHQDPIILRLFEEHAPFRETFEKMDSLLLGDNNSQHARATAAFLVTAIGGSVRHPLVTQFDDDTLRQRLLHLADSLLQQIDTE